MKPKPWQIAIIALGLLLGGGLILFSLAGEDGLDISDTYYLVDVESGQIYRADIKSNPVPIPAHHPETGRKSLIGIYRNQEGKFVVSSRDMSMIATLDKGVKNNAINPETGELNDQSIKPIDYPRR